MRPSGEVRDPIHIGLFEVKSHTGAVWSFRTSGKSAVRRLVLDLRAGVVSARCDWSARSISQLPIFEIELIHPAICRVTTTIMSGDGVLVAPENAGLSASESRIGCLLMLKLVTHGETPLTLRCPTMAGPAIGNRNGKAR